MNTKNKTIIKGRTKIKNAWKDHEIVINQVELENGDLSGTFEGKLIMKESKIITNNELLIILNKRFDDIDKRFDNLEKRIDNIEKKLDLILATPTIQKEIDHNALSKLI